MFTYSNSTVGNLPPQMIPLSQKDEKWKKEVMDALETTGRTQFNENLKLIENYEMIKGKFIFSHYFEDASYTDMLAQLTKEVEMPSYLRHYDIISQVINTMSGEYQKRPDNFKIEAHNEEAYNEFIRQKSSMILDYVQQKIDAEINSKLVQMGIDPNRTDFSTPQEQQQFEQQLQQQKQALTPPEIENYMQMSWLDVAEQWAQHQLSRDKDKFKLDEKEKLEFEDMLVADRCFRHFYLTPNGYEQETWNPINTFFHKSPEVTYIEEGDYVGRSHYLTASAIIDRFGYFLTEEELSSLQEESKKDRTKWNYAPGTEYVFEDYLEPFKGAREYTLMQETLGFKNIEKYGGGIPYADEKAVGNLFKGGSYNGVLGLHLVTEGYWKSHKKIGKVVYPDPETGLMVKLLIDENVIIPKNFKEKDSTFDDREEPFTVTWSWINETWTGTKIKRKTSQTGTTDDIYFNIKPLEFQFKGDLNPYRAKLPVCGQVFSVRNSQSMSLVDMMKPFQIGHNVAMNQLYQIMEREVGRFVVMDSSMFLSGKDWGGGEKSWDKFMTMAKALGMTVADTSPQNTQGVNVGGQYPKMMDLDESSRMQSRLIIADAFELKALKQVGFNEYRLGQQTSSATATGVQEGKQASFSQTESYFTNFSNYKRRCMEMDLNIAQYVQANDKDVTVMYTKSDMSRAFMKLNGTQLMMADLEVYVANSQEQIRQLEMLRNLGLENNTSGATIVDLADIITSSSPSEIKNKLKQSLKQQQAREDKQYQLQEQQMEQEQQVVQLKEQKLDERQDKELKNRKEIAYIQTFSKAEDNLKDTNSDNTPDLLEYDKLGAKKDADSAKIATQQEKNDLTRDKLISDKEINIKKLQLEREKLASKEKIEKDKIKVAKVLKGQKQK